MAAHLKTCAQLDRSIRQESQTRTIFDPEVRRLRAALRAEGEAALLADYRTSLVCAVFPVLPAQFWCPPVRLRSRCPACPMPHCVKLQLAGAAACRSHSPPLDCCLFCRGCLPQKHDVEQLLWKAVFYRPIEEFRWAVPGTMPRAQHAACGWRAASDEGLGACRLPLPRADCQPDTPAARACCSSHTQLLAGRLRLMQAAHQAGRGRPES